MIDYVPRAILTVLMSKLDENLEALHLQVDAHLERLASERRAIAEAARTTEPPSVFPERVVDSEVADESGVESSPSEASPTAEPDKVPVPKPADMPDHDTPLPLQAAKGPALPVEGKNTIIHPPATDADANASLGFLGRIFRRLRWW